MNEDFSRKVIATLSDLVAINSINPMFSPDGKGEAEVALYLDRFFSALATKITRQPVFEGRDNMIFHFPGQDNSKTLIFEAHMDTVSCDLSKPGGLAPVIKNGRLYGRGACDTKGSMAGMMWAIKSLMEEGELPMNILFVGTVDEEHRATGIYKLIESGVQADGAIVGEPTNLHIVIAHKGVYRFSVNTRGKAAHGSAPQNGTSAIYKMVDIINALRAKVEPSYQNISHELVGRPTMNIGLITGGKEINTVPDFCSISIDRRVIPGEDRERVEKEFDDLMDELREKDGDLVVTIENRFFDPPLSTGRTEKIVTAARAACEGILGAPVIEGATYGSDASKLAGIGIPTIVLGPGDIKNAHSSEEYIALDEVVTAARVYREIIKRFSEGA